MGEKRSKLPNSTIKQSTPSKTSNLPKKKIENNSKLPNNEETVEEIDFRAPCPVQQCVNKDKVYRWRHRNCGGYEKLTILGELRCVKCGKKEKFVHWRFKCEDHDYLSASYQGVAHALCIMSQIADNSPEQNFIATTTKTIMEQFTERMQNED